MAFGHQVDSAIGFSRQIAAYLFGQPSQLRVCFEQQVKAVHSRGQLQRKHLGKLLHLFIQTSQDGIQFFLGKAIIACTGLKKPAVYRDVPICYEPCGKLGQTQSPRERKRNARTRVALLARSDRFHERIGQAPVVQQTSR